MTLAVILLAFAAGLVKTDLYNRRTHRELFSGSSLFTAEAAAEDAVSVRGGKIAIGS